MFFIAFLVDYDYLRGLLTFFFTWDFSFVEFVNNLFFARRNNNGVVLQQNFSYLSLAIPIIGLNCVLLLVHCLFVTGIYTVLERKLMALMQRRTGPNVAPLLGVAQFLADGLKLVVKQLILPRSAQLFVFLFGPVSLLVFALTQWGLIPINSFSSLSNDLELSVLLSLMISSLGVIALVGAAWAANSKYPLLAALRSVSLLISYELIFSFIILTVGFLTGSLSFLYILTFQQFFQIRFLYVLLPLVVIYAVIALMETNRSPYDIAEAESELGAGYNTEHSSLVFSLFFLSEYMNMIFLSAVVVILFWGTSLFAFVGIFFTLVFMFFFILVRGIAPRFRFDIIMNIGWKCLLPVVIGYFLFIVGFFVSTQNIPSAEELPYLVQTLQKRFFLFKPVLVPATYIENEFYLVGVDGLLDLLLIGALNDQAFSLDAYHILANLENKKTYLTSSVSVFTLDFLYKDLVNFWGDPHYSLSYKLDVWNNFLAARFFPLKTPLQDVWPAELQQMSNHYGAVKLRGHFVQHIVDRAVCPVSAGEE